MSATPSKAGKIANFAMFQVVWFAVVLSAAERVAWFGMLIASAWLVVHVHEVAARGRELRVIAAVTVCGLAFDQLSVALGIQVFDGFTLHVGLVPLWIACLWAAFATTLNSSFAWIKGRYLLAAILGAVLGPMVYRGAESIGALTLAKDPPWLSFVGLGVEWAVIMPLAAWFARDRDVAAPVRPIRAMP